MFKGISVLIASLKLVVRTYLQYNDPNWSESV